MHLFPPMVFLKLFEDSLQDVPRDKKLMEFMNDKLFGVMSGDEDAVMAKRLMHGVHNTMTQYTAFAQMDPLFWNICPPTLYRYHLCTSQVYYLVPYPQFELFLDK